ncbi:MAG: anthranilate synthase component I family protein [Bacteroidales bacterium]|nr:anthranilate synthase component I family protein [Bacteroidales bacterium]MBP5725309.1 anthranilate synthase component I family protein [Bacteroidales bacterium]MBR4690302.1 anthranilate synthase component I family protein [Bacteroidales bacterium]
MKKFSYTVFEKQMFGDTCTPVSVYMRIRNLYTQSALMECSDYHSSENGCSYIGVRPIAHVAIEHGLGKCVYPDGSLYQHPINANYLPSDIINEFLNEFNVNNDKNLGLFGYTSFNSVRYLENIAVKDETQVKNDAPDMIYILYKYVITFNHFDNTMSISELAADGEKSDIETIEKAIQKPFVTKYEFHHIGETTSTLTDEQHKENIRKGIEHCKRGDVFQIVLSRRFVQPYEGDDFNVYRALRRINPSPYLFYFDFGGFRIFGSSPETHCRVKNENGKFIAYIDPIAGTTKRTGDEVQDAKNAEYLRNDPKENAEHVMLVDLARNDLSRNCHDVHVDFYKELQYYSHVIHLVSRVSGTLDDDKNPVKAFMDTFPAGTLSGAPKIRAMQLISEYEPHNRGMYGGCVGFIGFDGSLNQAITIRTFVSRNNELWFQAGGGIVAQSDEEYELQEVNNKLGALRRAIILAEEA